MTPSKMTYVARATDPGLAGWQFTIAPTDGTPSTAGVFTCAGAAGTITVDHAWTCATAYYNELGYQIVEIVEGA